MRNYEHIEEALKQFKNGSYKYEDGKIYSMKRKRFLKGTVKGKGKYLAFSIIHKGIRIKPAFHTVIYALHYGIDELKKHETIDHIDGDKYNNHIANLEGCSVHENNYRWNNRNYDSML